ncbi:hypothetical protein BKA80DRAFT_256024 [Phyllosticta citrichinensis]
MKPELVSSDLTTTDGVNSFIKALKTTSLSKLGKDALNQLGERIYSLPTDTQADAIKAIIESAETDKAIMCEVVDRVAAKTRADKAAHPSQSKAHWRRLLTKFDMTLRRLRPDDPVTERRLFEIEEFWGIRITNRYMSLPSSVLTHLAAIAEEVEHSVAAAYLNAEVLARKERKVNGAKGKVSSGLGITPGDTKNAKAKIQGNEPVPVLSADLLAKHRLRVSKNTGLLKPIEEDESDEECDFDKYDGESGNASKKEKSEDKSEDKNGGGVAQEQKQIDEDGGKGELSQEQNEAEPTHTSVKNQSEQEDAQESEKGDCLSVGDAGGNAEVQDKEPSTNAEDEDEDDARENSMDQSEAELTHTSVKQSEQEDVQEIEKGEHLFVGDAEVHGQEQSNTAANEDEGEKGEKSQEQSDAGPSTGTSVKRQLEEQEDEQPSKRVRLSDDAEVNDQEQNDNGNEDEGEKADSGKDAIEADPSTCTSEKPVCQSVSDTEAKESVKEDA